MSQDVEVTWEQVGAEWVFSDGTRLPVVAGGSDAGVAEPATAEPAAPAEAVPAAEPAAAPAAADPVDPFDNPALTSFDRPYVEKLRQEAADHRVKAKTFEDAFSGYDDADRDTLLEFARTLRTDPRTAAQWMAEQAQLLLDANAEPAGQQQDPAGDDPNRPLTAADLDRLLEQRETTRAQQAQQQQALDGVYQQIRDASFDPEGPDGTAILTIAANQTDYDVGKAIETWKARDQKIIDDALAALKGEAAGSAHTPPQSGAAREAEGELGALGSAQFRQQIRQQIEARQR